MAAALSIGHVTYSPRLRLGPRTVPCVLLEPPVDGQYIPVRCGLDAGGYMLPHAAARALGANNFVIWENGQAAALRYNQFMAHADLAQVAQVAAPAP